MTNLISASTSGLQRPQPSATALILSSMAPKAHGAHRSGSAISRTHSRTSSTGASRLGLSNLTLTQKEPAPAKHSDKQKKAHTHFEQVNGRGVGHISRNNSSVRLQQKDPANATAQRRPSASSSSRGTSSKHKAGFTIASPTEEPDDDDEWISSESGAATPSHESDIEESTTPIDRVKPHFPPGTVLANGFAKDDHPTPRAELPGLPVLDMSAATVRNTQASDNLPNGHAPLAHDYVPQPSQPVQSQQHKSPPSASQQISDSPDSSPLALPQSLPPVTRARSETHSPPRRSPDAEKRSMTRPPSSNSIHGSSAHALKPHPLIRAHSHGHGAFFSSAKPAPLAPLTTVPAESAPGEMTATTSPTSARAVSPTLSIHCSMPSPVLSYPSPTVSEASRQLRRSSTSSRSSIATMPPAPAPMQASASHAQLTKATNHDRQRTLSSSSTFAALSSLNIGRRTAPSPPKTPLQHMTVFFPPLEHSSQSDSPHPLLPPPYSNAHATMLACRNPLAESHDRVMRAKTAR